MLSFLNPVSLQGAWENYGFLPATESTDFSSRVVVNYQSLELPKPVRSENYSVVSSVLIDGHRYFNSYSSTLDMTYKTYPDFTDAKAEFSLESDIDASYNGLSSQTQASSVYGTNAVRETLDTHFIDSISEFPAVSFMHVNTDSAARTVSVSTDAIIDSFNLNYLYTNIVMPSGERFIWHIYSPSSLTIRMPQLESDFETQYAGSRVDSQRLYLIKDNSATNYSDALAIRRFNDPVTGVRNSEYSESYQRTAYYDFVSQNKAATKNKKSKKLAGSYHDDIEFDRNWTAQ